MKILVTGFEPFGGESRNPSMELVKSLPGEIGGAEIVTAILPVTGCGSADAVTAVIRANAPDVVLSIGQAGGRSAVTVERVAVNVDDFRIPDNNGDQPVDVPIAADGPDAYLCRLPVRDMVETMRAAGVPAEISNSAGTYVCNHLMYAVAHLLAREYPAARSGFIHIPFLPEQVTDKPGQPSMTAELSLRAVTAAIEVLTR